MPIVKRVLAVLFVLLFFGAKNVMAGCEISASSQYLQPNSNVSYELSVRNSGDYALLLVSIQKSFGSMLTSVETEVQGSGWNQSVGGDWDTYSSSGGVIAPGDTLKFNIRGVTGSEQESFTWNYQAAADSGGESAESCNSLDFTVTESIPTTPPVYIPPPVISQLVVAVESAKATLSWHTDVNANSIVNYGTGTGYGSNVTDNTPTQSHQLVLSSLAASTLYHYQVSSGNSDGTTVTTDATFTTTAVGTTATTTTVTTTTTSSSTSAASPTPTPKPLVDTIPPSISIKTDFSKPFLESPTIVGTSTDSGDINVGVVSMDYSLDGGKNWLPMDVINGTGSRTVSFEFTPSRLDDGNYSIVVRAKDSTGNIGKSRAKITMVIDRLPPQVGGSLFSLGPMILKPDYKGNIYSIAGLEMKMILSAVGGPIAMDFLYNSQKYPLLKNEESGLWSGMIKTDKAENIPLKIDSVDGAKNETNRNVGTIVALNPGKVTDEKGQPISKAKIKIYTFEKTLNDFVLWESMPYLQLNPQETDENGEYRLMIPSGKYFLEVEMKGKRKLRTEIFEIEVASPINQNFSLELASWYNWWWSKVVPISLVNNSLSNDFNSDLIDKMAPDFDLSVGENIFSSTSILGKPTVITFISTWEPQSSDQLLALDNFKTENEGINVVAVVAQESVSKVNIFKKIGGYKLPIVADPDGTLVMPFNLGSLPTHIFLDRKGIIKDIRVGFLDKNSLLKRILN